MTKEEFVSKLPASIENISFSECRLKILEDNKFRKIVCYIADHIDEIKQEINGNLLAASTIKKLIIV
jgi:hypothetical protein